MIQLHSDYLVFKTANGNSVPCSAEMVVFELMGDSAKHIDEELIHNATAAVLHYFKTDLRRNIVSVEEFTEAVAEVLRGFGIKVTLQEEIHERTARISVADLFALVDECGPMRELTFFPQLRLTVQACIEANADVVHLKSLKTCVKVLAGAKHWCPRCEPVRDRLLEFVHSCCLSDKKDAEVSLMIN